VKQPLIFISLAAMLALNSTLVSAAKPSTELEKFSYAIGFQVGQGFKRDNLEIDTAVMSQAINDVLNNKAPQLDMSEMRAAMEATQKKIIGGPGQQG